MFLTCVWFVQARGLLGDEACSAARTNSERPEVVALG